MFGDNKLVVNGTIKIYAKLHKRHSILSFHRVREAVASSMLVFTLISGSDNPAGILSKHWAYSDVWQQLRCLQFYEGETVSES